MLTKGSPAAEMLIKSLVRSVRAGPLTGRRPPVGRAAGFPPARSRLADSPASARADPRADSDSGVQVEKTSRTFRFHRIRLAVVESRPARRLGP